MELRELLSKDMKTLASFIIPPKRDNALTWAIRQGRSQAFEYLLHARHISPALANHKGHNALHFAIRTERYSFLTYMLQEKYLYSEEEI